jgi:large subunit ribosomal protein L3
MFTVPRPGQHGYHNRTVFGKKLLLVGEDPASQVNRKGGFKRYGEVSTNFALIAGTIPGPSKRVVALRRAIRKQKRLLEISDIEYISK